MSNSLGHILIVDDDENIVELLSVNLRSEGYTVDVVATASEVDRDSMDDIRLVIVDAMHQPYSGMDLIYDFKDDIHTEHIGIILYSTIKNERMVIDALDAGADDYITKPFSLRELVARVKSVMRRHMRRPVVAAGIALGPISLDVASQTARLDGQPLALSKTEYAILALLVKNRDNYVSRSEIMDKVWGADAASTNERVVDTNISRLRKKLGDEGARIVNRSGHGYMIN